MGAEGRPQLKILILAPFAPHPAAPHGGARVLAQLVAGLAMRHRIALFYIRATDEMRIDEQITAACEIIEEVERPGVGLSVRQQWLRRAHYMYGFCRGKPMQVTDWAIHAYRERVRHLAQTWQPDIVQFEYHIMGQYLDAVNWALVPLVLNEYEPGAQAALDREQAGGRGYACILDVLDRFSWQRFESQILNRMPAVVVFTEQDRQVLAQMTDAERLHVIPFGSTLPMRPLNYTGTDELSILFVGSFIHTPNVDAALRLASTIFPQVTEHVPDVKLYIVGDQAPPHLQHLANERITITGFVPDVAPYLDQATVVVVPLRLGGGMRVKVVEALAAGKAIVATSLAVAGLDVRSHEHLVLAESDREFVSAIVELLRDPERRTMLATNARVWAEQHLGSDSTIRAYENLYYHLIKARS